MAKTKEAKLGMTYVPNPRLLGTMTDLELAETAYAGILKQEKELDEMKKQIVQKVRSEMEKSGKDTYGKFVSQERRSLSWSLTGLKKVLPKEWQAYIKTDDKLLKVKAESVKELMDEASITVTTAIIFKA